MRVSNAVGSITSLPANLEIGIIEPPVFENPAWNRETGFSVLLRSQIQTTCRIQVSTDLIQWIELTNFTAAALMTPIVDSAAANQPSMRYYRALVGHGGGK